MSTQPELCIYNHQDTESFSDELLERFRRAAQLAVPKVLALAIKDPCALSLLDEVEVSFIDDAKIADVHVEFMNIPGATDVITFDHGEIHISVEMAKRQAEEFGNHYHSELILYIIHGLLHLAGYADGTEPERHRMNYLQSLILDDIKMQINLSV